MPAYFSVDRGASEAAIQSFFRNPRAAKAPVLGQHSAISLDAVDRQRGRCSTRLTSVTAHYLLGRDSPHGQLLASATTDALDEGAPNDGSTRGKNGFDRLQFVRELECE